MRKDRANTIVVKSPAEDYGKCQQYVEDLLKNEKVSNTVIMETTFIFEAIYNNIFEQNKDSEIGLTLKTEKRWGNTCIRLDFEGNMYRERESEYEELIPEERIVKAYRDRIDHRYSAGHNVIRLTVKRNRGMAALPCFFAFLAAVLVYALLDCFLNTEEEHYVMNEVVLPLERWGANLVLMVGAPVTFISFVKNMTDSFIILDRKSDIRKIRNVITRSSVISVLLAILTLGFIMQVIKSPNIEYNSQMSVEVNLPEILTTLIPTDIFTPFMLLSPFPILILAAIVTVALCSVGKYFDRMKEIIDMAYTLFSGMLTVVMYILPVFLFLAVMDILLDEGFSVFLPYFMIIPAVLLGFLVIGIFYWLRLRIRRIPVRDFVRKLGPLLRENYKIGSAIDAAPFNIRYCIRAWNMNRKKLEINVPVLAEINLDGNCFFMTLIPMLLVFCSDAEVTPLNMVMVGILAIFLSLGAPNQPGSVLIGMLIILYFMNADDLISNAFIAEVLFGSMLNIVNVLGDIVTVYELDKEGDERT